MDIYIYILYRCVCMYVCMHVYIKIGTVYEDFEPNSNLNEVVKLLCMQKQNSLASSFNLITFGNTLPLSYKSMSQIPHVYARCFGY